MAHSIHVTSGHEAVQPEALLQALETSKEPEALHYAASCLTHLIHAGDITIVPSSTASQLLRAIFNIGNQAEYREASAPLFSALLDLVRARYDDLKFVQASISMSKDAGHYNWAKGLLQAMFLDEATFVPGCFLLALVAEHEGARYVLREAGALSKICSHIMSKKSSPIIAGGIQVPFMVLATAGVEALCPLTIKEMTEDEMRWGPPAWVRSSAGQDIVEAVIETLNDGLLVGDMIAKPLHLAALRTLQHLAQLCRDCALRIVEDGGLRIAAQILASNTSTEEVVLAALALVAVIGLMTPRTKSQLEPLGIYESARKAQKRYTRSLEIQQAALSVLGQSIVPLVKPHWPPSEPSGPRTGVVVKAPTRGMCR